MVTQSLLAQIARFLANIALESSRHLNLGCVKRTVAIVGMTMKFERIKPILLTLLMVCLAWHGAFAQQAAPPGAETVAPEWKSGRFVEESFTPDTDADQAIIPTESETVAFSLPGTGWLLGFQDIGEVKTVLEFVPAGHTIHDWKEVVSFQTFRVQPDVTPGEFADQISEHWKKNCKNVQSSVLQKWKRGGYDAVLGLTDCSEASYSLVPEYMMYLIIRGKNRLHLVQRSTRGRELKVNNDAWIKFFDAVNICPRTKEKEDKCLPKHALVEGEVPAEKQTEKQTESK